MVNCQIDAVARHALPSAAMPVRDRRMSLETVCREPATFTAKLGGLSVDHDRKKAAVREFVLCPNHSELLAQVDRELMEDGWGTMFIEKPRSLE